MGIENVKSENNNSSLANKLDSFFEQAQYIKKGPKFNDLLAKKGYLSYMMFTGSSGAGKTTQVTNINDLPNSLHSSWDNGLFGLESIYYTIATRYITRKGRNSDNKTGFNENIHVDNKEEFLELVRKGDIEIYWERDLGSEQVLYGFESNWKISGEIAKKRRMAKKIIGTDVSNRVRLPQQGGIIVYSGNNDMARNFQSIPFCRNHKDEFVHLHVQAEDNTQRFIERSKDVAAQDQKQLQKRASDDGSDVLAMSHIVITNTAGQQESIHNEIEELMNLFAHYNEKMCLYNPQYTADEISKAINPGFSYKAAS